MPSRNIIKEYQENGIYHIYNRGVEKRAIFQDTRDYKTFLYFLKQYLLPEEHSKKGTSNYKGRTFVRRSFDGRIELLGFCLMPNHFHLIIKQTGERDISEFLKCLITSYSIYFNDRNNRVGSLFQGRYKAVLIKDDSYLLHLSRYIHLNPVKGNYKGRTFVKLAEYDYSSYQDYIGFRNTEWVKPKFILDYFESKKEFEAEKFDSYRNFVESLNFSSEKILGNLTLE